MQFKIVFLVLMLATVSCAQKVKKAISDAKYSAWESVGMEKRDLFKREVSNVKEDQEESGEAFKDSLTRLKEVYAFDGGNLEKEYNKLNSSYENARDESLEVSASINKLNQVAEDLFVEWRSELNEISTSDLRSRSSEQLKMTKASYAKLYNNLKQSEKKVAPVLTRLKDQVLYLKHNLNSKAIGGLRTEGDRIQSEIQQLIQDMDKSSKEAAEFIKTL